MAKEKAHKIGFGWWKLILLLCLHSLSLQSRFGESTRNLLRLSLRSVFLKLAQLLLSLSLFVRQALTLTLTLSFK